MSNKTHEVAELETLKSVNTTGNNSNPYNPANNGIDTSDTPGKGDGASIDSREALHEVILDSEVDSGDAQGTAGAQQYASSSKQQPENNKEEVEDDQHTLDLKQFVHASQRGDLETIREFIESGRVSVNETLDDNVTALHWAAINNKLKSLKYLISHGADVNYLAGELQSSPLLWACRFQCFTRRSLVW
ncbi:unnamed protein product [Ambrosiozyma monospora]|uniref:Unnamed protein product n=1 Tax=Ambrosiozyma monospora TaxID=43982 RepID=A0ACB5U6C8_AMBMO|nr:unnamed protein product [Ambrosiozyma monospora]